MFHGGDILKRADAGGRGKSRLRWLLLAVLFATAVFCAFSSCKSGCRPPEPTPSPSPVARIFPVTNEPVRLLPPFRNLVYPTPQTNLLRNNGMGALQPTASGRPESGAYGSGVRQGRFHEGIDIAAVRRDRSNRPLDPIFAVARGRVGYVNRVAGNSKYGIYVVLVHDDPIGQVYTLYAHMDHVADGIAAGREVAAGAVLGRMGNTPSSIIPRDRAHLHFEVGLIANSRFREWFRSRRLKPDHGIYNGWNLYGMDPMAFLAAAGRGADFSFRDHVRAIPRAFELVVKTKGQVDFFRRYPGLWDGPEHDGGPIVISCSEKGIPLSGRNAGEDEEKKLGDGGVCVFSADGDLSGTAGPDIVERNGDKGWKMTEYGMHWLDILTY